MLLRSLTENHSPCCQKTTNLKYHLKTENLNPDYCVTVCGWKGSCTFYGCGRGSIALSYECVMLPCYCSKSSSGWCPIT